MRLRRLRFRGLSSAFPGSVDLSFAGLDPGVIAVVGPNGSGKTIVLEASGPGAIYRKLPARAGANIVDFAVARNSFVSLDFDFDGAGYFRSLVNLDGSTRKTDALLQQIDLATGDALDVNNGQASTYDAAIRDRFPSLDLFLNSSFAAQGRGDEFTRATPSKRKDLFAEFLNLRRLLTMSATAGQAAALHSQTRARLQGRLEQLQRWLDPALEERRQARDRQFEQQATENADRRAGLDIGIRELEARRGLAGDAAAAHNAALLQVVGIDRQLVDRKNDRTAADRQRTEYLTISAPGELRSLESVRERTVKDLDDRIAGNKAIQDQGNLIRSAADQMKAIDGELAALPDLVLLAGHRQAAADLVVAADRRISAFAAPQRELERSRQDAALLESVPCGGQGEFAGCQFLINATAAAGRIGELEALLQGVAAAIRDRDSARAGLEAIDAEGVTVRGRQADLARRRLSFEHHAKYATALAESDSRLAELTRQRADVLEAAAGARQAAVDRHAQRVREFDDQVGGLDQAIDRLQASRTDAQAALDAAAAGNTQQRELEAALARARAAWDDLTRLEASVAAGVAQLQQEREATAAAVLARDHAQQLLERVDADLAAWQFLAKALGKGGLPDLEIDAAGPTISGLTNDLLTATYGARFSVDLVTQVEKADASGMRDEFTVRVLDNLAAGDGWRDVAELSGGERVIVQEAIMLAICIYVNDRSPRPIRTLWRDETGAALDPDNAVHYLDMLRKARELGSFVHVLFVSHNPDIVARADAQILVGAGEARIVQAPFEGTV